MVPVIFEFNELGGKKMLVKDIIARIRFQTNTNDDNTGRNANALFSNKNLVGQLQICLNQYASFTRAIENVFSYPLVKGIRSIKGPTDVIRGSGYRYIYLWRDGYRYSINIKPLNFVNTRFPRQTINGIPQFVSLWEDEIYFYPDADTNRATTTLTNEVSETDTTIDVSSTTDFPVQNGRLTLTTGEKIRYETKSDTQFLNCTRGLEGTTVGYCSSGGTVQENNLMIFYFAMVNKIRVDDNDVVFPEDMSLDLKQIPEEHMISIIDLTSYMLLQKVDAERAAPYKVDAAGFLRQAKDDINYGRSDITAGYQITHPYDFEIANTGYLY